MIVDNVEIHQDAIAYASLLQKGMLPKTRHFKKAFQDFGIIWLPHSALSGDFYWLTIKDNNIFLAVGDCTGHGVASALLSVMGISILNYLVASKNFQTTGEYLNEMDKKWIETFQSEVDTELFNNDWLEIALIRIDTVTQTLQFSGARQKIVIKRNNQLITWKGNRFPIGGWQLERKRIFDTQSILLNKNDEVYLFTDGIIHQHGGEYGKKFGLKRFLQNIISEDSSVRIKTENIKETLDKWQASFPQTDDITLVAFKW